MQWKQVPDSYGWWFFTKRREDWDLAEPVRVSMRVHPDDTKEFFLSRPRDRDGTIQPGDGWWYGPIVLKRPEGQQGYDTFPPGVA